jgi:hypothetical protein
MQEIPKSLRDAMARQALAGQHPDADLLTAFSEGSATPRERETITAHLATCAECREVVALAMPPQPVAVAPTSAAEPSRVGFLRRWLWVPALGAAAVVTISASLLLHRERQETPLRQPMGVVGNVENTAPPAAVPNEEQVVPKENRSKKDSPGKAGKLAAGSPATAPAVIASDRYRKSLDETAQAREDSPSKEKQERQPSMSPLPAGPSLPAQPSAPVPLGRSTDSLAVRKEQDAARSYHGAPAASSQTVEVQAETVEVQSAADARVALRDENKVAQAQAKRPVAPQVSSPARAGEPQGYAGGLLAKAVPPPASAGRFSWRIDNDGRAERSPDNSTWTQVPLGTRIRVISTVGVEVWAGAEGGTLFHSSDNGEHWATLHLEGSSAAVTSIRFQDVQHGTAKTDAGETWTTADSGRTWRKSN